jgi:hypothetical protein
MKKPIVVDDLLICGTGEGETFNDSATNDCRPGAGSDLVECRLSLLKLSSCNDRTAPLLSDISIRPRSARGACRTCASPGHHGICKSDLQQRLLSMILVLI